MFKDFTGKKLEVGDFVIRVGRSGSNVVLDWAIVAELNPAKIKIRRLNSEKASNIRYTNYLVAVNYLDVPEDVKKELEACL